MTPFFNKLFGLGPQHRSDAIKHLSIAALDLRARVETLEKIVLAATGDGK